MHASILLNSDSTIIAKLDAIAKTLDKKPDAAVISVCVAILAGTLVWVGQYIDRRAKKKVELSNQLLETYHQCQLKLFEVRTLCTVLAMERSLLEFHCCYKEIAISIEQEDLIKQYDEKAYQNSNKAIETLASLNDRFASYFACVLKFSILAKLDITASELESRFNNIKFEDAPRITATDWDECGTISKGNREKLITAYVGQLRTFNELNEQLDTITKAKFKALSGKSKDNISQY